MLHRLACHPQALNRSTTQDPQGSPGHPASPKCRTLRSDLAYAWLERARTALSRPPQIRSTLPSTIEDDVRALDYATPLGL